MKKKALSILLTLAMVITMIPVFSITANAGEIQSEVSYRYPVYVDGDIEKGILKWESGKIGGANAVSSYTEINSTNLPTKWGVSEKATWYVVNGDNLKINSQVELAGDVNLILKDGAKLTISVSGNDRGIHTKGKNISIYAQSNDDTMGKLIVNTTNGINLYCSQNDSNTICVNGGSLQLSTSSADNGINIDKGKLIANGGILNTEGANIAVLSKSGKVIINGGSVTSNGSEYGLNSHSGSVIMNGGKLEANGEKHGVFLQLPACTFVVNDGNVKAEGKGETSGGIYTKGSFTINKGEVSATCNGTSGYGIFADGGITVNNGSIDATGGSEGLYSGEGEIIIKAGKVTATGYDDTHGGINAKKNVTIDGGVVTATGGSEGIYSKVGDITINNGTVTAIGTKLNSYAIYSEKNVNINGGKVIANSKHKGLKASSLSIAQGLAIVAGSDADNAMAKSSYSDEAYVLIANAVCQIASDKYGTIESALKTVKTSTQTTIELLRNADESITILADADSTTEGDQVQNIILDLKGFNINAENGSAITNNGSLKLTSTGTTAGSVSGATNGVVQNGTFTLAGKAGVTNIYLKNNKTLTIDSGYSGSSTVSTETIPGNTPVTISGVNSADFSSKITSADGTNYKVYDSISGENHTLILSKHEHNWSFVQATTTSANDTIKVYCAESFGNTNCSNNGETNSDIVIIKKPLKTAYGDSNNANATLVDSTGNPKTSLCGISSIPGINYAGRNGTEYESINAPADAGKYTASITVGGKTASVDYEISKGAAPTEPTVSIDFINETTNEVIGSTIEYRKSTDTSWTTGDGNKVPLDADTTYEFKVKETGNVLAGSVASVVVPARPAKPSLSGTNETIKNKKDAKLSGVTSEMEYKVDGGEWTVGTGEDILNPENKSIDVRIKATQTCYASEAQTVEFVPSEALIKVTIGTEESQVEYGSSLIKPNDPINDGYDFGGWYSDAQFTKAWNFNKDTVTEELTLYPKWIAQDKEKSKISGLITDGTNPLNDVVVELMAGTDKVAATSTDSEGKYNFGNVENGNYNIVVTTETKVKTALVNVIQSGEYSIPTIVVSNKEVNSKVIVDENTDGNGKTDVTKVTVGGVDEIAEGENPDGSDKITITLKVENETDEAANPDQTAIKVLAGDKTVDFIEISLTKQVNNEEPTDIGKNNTHLLTINIPFDTNGIDTDSIIVYRYHDDVAEAFNRITSEADKADGTFMVNDGYLTVFASKFSSYGIGYVLTEESSGILDIILGGIAAFAGLKILKTAIKHSSIKSFMTFYSKTFILLRPFKSFFGGLWR